MATPNSTSEPPAQTTTPNQPAPQPVAASPGAAAPPAVATPPVDLGTKLMLDALGLALHGDKKEEPKGAETVADPNAFDDPLNRGTVGRNFSDTLRIADEQRALDAAAAAAAPSAPEGDAAAAGAQPAPAATAAANADPAAAATADKPIALERRKPVEELVETAVRKGVRDALAQPGAQKPAEAPAAPASPAADPFEATLSDSQRDELELARYAATKDPKYKDLPVKMLSFFKKVDDYVQKAATDGSFNPETDEAFGRFMAQNKPVFSPSDRKRIERQQIIEVAKEEAKRENADAIRAQQEQIHRLEAKPRVEQAVQAYVTESQQFLAGDETSPAAPIMKKAMEAGWDKTLAEDRVFAPLVKGIHDNSVRLAATYESLMNRIQPFQAENKDHLWLSNFVTWQAGEFQKSGGQALIRDGKSFVTPRELNEMSPEQKQRHWTFTSRDVLERLAVNTKRNIEVALKTEEEKLSASGFVRSKPQNQIARTETAAGGTPAAKPQPEAPAASPRSTPSAAPGAANTNPPAAHSPAFPAVLQNALGMPTRR